MSSTLSLGTTIDHIFSMSVPFLGGIIWKYYGYEAVFVMAGAVAALTALVSASLKNIHKPVTPTLASG